MFYINWSGKGNIFSGIRGHLVQCAPNLAHVAQNMVRQILEINELVILIKHYIAHKMPLCVCVCAILALQTLVFLNKQQTTAPRLSHFTRGRSRSVVGGEGLFIFVASYSVNVLLSYTISTDLVYQEEQINKCLFS